MIRRFSRFGKSGIAFSAVLALSGCPTPDALRAPPKQPLMPAWTSTPLPNYVESGSVASAAAPDLDVRAALSPDRESAWLIRSADGTLGENVEMVSHAGEMVTFSDGSWIRRHGNVYRHSDGSFTVRQGDTYVHSGGGWSRRVGNVIRHSDGRQCILAGNFIACSPATRP